MVNLVRFEWDICYYTVNLNIIVVTFLFFFSRLLVFYLLIFENILLEFEVENVGNKDIEELKECYIDE